jgi:hypothetical protein
MTKQFYEAILPTQGYYCVAGITVQGKISTRFCESVDEVLELVDHFNAQDGMNTYFTPSTYESYSRKQEASLFTRSLFLDIDCGEDKPYADQAEGMAALDKFIVDSGLPEPMRLNSGRGLYAYWIFESEVATSVWQPYADRFKQLTVDLGFEVDPAVPADSARLIRCPATLNWGKAKRPNVPPLPSELLSEIVTYPFEQLTSILDAVEVESKTDNVLDFNLKKVAKGLDDETRKMLGMDNYEFRFDKIAVDSLEDRGCAQIKWAIENAKTCPEPMWRSALSIAIACVDGDEAIHLLSEEHPDYTPEETEKKADDIRKAIDGTHTCATFQSHRPKGCDGCPHRGKFKSPYALGKTFIIAKPPVEEPETAPEEAESVREVPKNTPLHLPEYMRPFVMGIHGGIYYQPHSKTKKDGSVESFDPVLVVKHDLYPTQRLFSPYEGECLNMRLVLPRDGVRDFLLPMKSVSAQEEFKKVMSSNGVFTTDKQKTDLLMKYVTKWADYLLETSAAQSMRFQQGWSQDKQGYLVGRTEYRMDGSTAECPPSTLAKPVVDLIKPSGTYEAWRTAVDMLNDPGYEYHAFCLLMGFGSPLLRFTNVHGAVIGLLGEKGAGKTGALFAGLSVHGSPEELSVMDATENGLVQRMITLKNHMFGLDEFSNASGEALSKLIYSLCAGKGKIRLQSSTNAERPLSFMSALLSLITMNQSARDKVAAYKKDSGAEEVRYLEFTVRKPMVKGYELDDARGIAMFQTLVKNYGHAMPRFVKVLAELGEDEIQSRVDKWRERGRLELTTDSGYRFVNSEFSAVFAAGEIAVEHDIINIDIERIYKFMLAETHKVIDTSNKGIDYESVLGDFINSNLQNLLALKEGKVVMEPRGPLVMRADAERGILQISKTPVKDFLARSQIGVRAFEMALKERGVLLTADKKVRLGSGWKAGTGVALVYAYEFKTDLTEVFKNVEEAIGSETDGGTGVDIPLPDHEDRG